VLHFCVVNCAKLMSPQFVCNIFYFMFNLLGIVQRVSSDLILLKNKKNSKINPLIKYYIYRPGRPHIVMHDSLNSFQNIHNLWCWDTRSIKCKWYKHKLIVSTRSLMFDHSAWSSFEVVCPTVKFSVINPTSGKPQVKSTHAHSPPTHAYTKKKKIGWLQYRSSH
jgi:hypothetical protein